MKAKIKKAICIALIGVMVAHGTYARPIEAKAMGTVAISAGLTLFLVLASMGVVASEIYHAQHINDEWDEVVQSYKESMNAYKPGLYDDVMESRAKSNGQTLKIEADTWSDVRGWVASVPTFDNVVESGMVNNEAELRAYLEGLGFNVYTAGGLFYDGKPSAIYDGNRILVLGRYQGNLSCFVYRDTSGKIHYMGGDSDALKPLYNAYDPGVIVTARGVYMLGQGSRVNYMSKNFYSERLESTYASISGSPPYIAYAPGQYWSPQYYFDASKAKLVIDNGKIIDYQTTFITSTYDREIAEGVYDVLTPGRVLTEEKDDIDKRILVGDYTITIPKAKALSDVMDGVDDGTKDIADILPLINVIPVDLATDTTITDSRPITEAITDIPDLPLASDYIVRLEEFFPFCIPFDIYNIFRLFNAEPEAPAVRWKFPNIDRSGTISYVEYDIDLSQFDTVAQWLRRFELIAFVVGLLAATRHIMKE